MENKGCVDWSKGPWLEVMIENISKLFVRGVNILQICSNQYCLKDYPECRNEIKFLGKIALSYSSVFSRFLNNTLFFYVHYQSGSSKKELNCDLDSWEINHSFMQWSSWFKLFFKQWFKLSLSLSYIITSE